MAKVLVVDDVAEVRFIVRDVLEKGGHEVEEASDGDEALEILGLTAGKKGTFFPDLIVLDIMMPKVDGLTVNHHLEQSEDYRSVPVIILTARGEMLDPFKQAANVAAIIEKPCRPASIRETIEKVLKKAGKS